MNWKDRQKCSSFAATAFSASDIFGNGCLTRIHALPETLEGIVLIEVELVHATKKGRG